MPSRNPSQHVALIDAALGGRRVRLDDPPVNFRIAVAQVQQRLDRQQQLNRHEAAVAANLYADQHAQQAHLRQQLYNDAQQAYTQPPVIGPPPLLSERDAPPPLAHPRYASIAVPREYFDSLVWLANDCLSRLPPDDPEAVRLTHTLRLITSMPNGPGPVTMSARVEDTPNAGDFGRCAQQVMQRIVDNPALHNQQQQMTAASWWNLPTDPQRARGHRSTQRYSDTEPEDL